VAFSSADMTIRRPGVLISRAAILVYLLYLVGAIRDDSTGVGQVAGFAILAAFAVCWLLVPVALSRRSWLFALYGLMSGLFLAELFFAHAAAFVMAVFLTIILIACYGARPASIATVVVLTLASLLVPPAVPSWHTSLYGAFTDVTPVAIPVAALLTYSTLRAMQTERALADAQTELARLAAENERFRIARDLHDVLGHSLTTITVKAGLASRLGQVDKDRAMEEIAEVETLARQTLADVRNAVAGYREVTLAGELANGRELLRAAGVSVDLPGAVDVVAPEHQELFGWVVREGLTNVVRHARAGTCAVRLSRSTVEITDDGSGGTLACGNGLNGLRERVTAAGGVVEAGPDRPRGWKLRVSMGEAG
jgi:two-component system, NarL family, sensor histidine kinase DesK